MYLKFYIISIVVLFLTLTAATAQKTLLVSGQRHVFSIDVPEDCTNDMELAQHFGLPCFIYPQTEGEGMINEYIYAMGVDKNNKNDKLSSFIAADIKKFGAQNPNLTIEKDTLTSIDGTKQAIHYTFSNLNNRHTEEVVYTETDWSFVVLSFASTTQEGFEKYKPQFNQIIDSFKYLGNNPDALVEL